MIACAVIRPEDNTMRIAKNDVPVRIDVPGATARQQKDFGTAAGYAEIGGEYFSLAAGTDLAPLLEGLEDDLCQSPHWGYMLEGEVVVAYADGTEEVAAGGGLFYWPPGHSVRVNLDAEIVLFSPQHEHGAALDNIETKLRA